VDRLRIKGGRRLAGDVVISGAKNSALKLMATSLLTEGELTLTAVPRIQDVRIMAELLRRLGCDVRLGWVDDGTSPGGELVGSTVSITVPAEVGTSADYDLVRRLRASTCVLGALLARRGQAKVAYPGGDAIGSRGIDMHVDGLAKLGARIEHRHGFVLATAPDGLVGAPVMLDFPSVGATENVLLAAVLARGTTVIDNAAREPEVVDIADMLSQMGAKIDGAGTSTIQIEGVDRLAPTSHRVVPDRIVAGMYAVAAVMTGGDVRLREAHAGHLEIALDKLVTAGADVTLHEDGFQVRMDGRPRAVDVVTLPYPGFATDLQPLFVALDAIADGTAMITENIFDARFAFLQELVRLGASVRSDGHHAVVRGVPRLSGAPVRATDIRAGASLVLAGLVADGYTLVGGVEHIDRGYQDLEFALRGLGAELTREPDPDAEQAY
jgi:UDP-N-acetylglucosamine 1-carboxyvinyltransferase